MSPVMHINRPGDDDETTETKIAAGRLMGMFRQCSLGYHEECSDPNGDECTCGCHREGGEETHD
jgi:hypothetical protein